MVHAGRSLIYKSFLVKVWNMHIIRIIYQYSTMFNPNSDIFLFKCTKWQKEEKIYLVYLVLFNSLSLTLQMKIIPSLQNYEVYFICHLSAQSTPLSLLLVFYSCREMEFEKRTSAKFLDGAPSQVVTLSVSYVVHSQLQSWKVSL